MAHQSKEAAIQAIRDLHGDLSVSQEETLSALEEVREEIDIMIDAVKNDLKD